MKSILQPTRLPDCVPPAEKQRRVQTAMAVQEKISLAKNEALIGHDSARAD
jgi:tRNA A37 methylthiotransferase MiaB